MTTLVQPDWFHLDTNYEAQLLANQLAVPPDFFAEVSCEGDRLFGLVTACKRQTCQDTCETVLNECARRNLWQYSYMVQQELEATLRWTLSPRYITETLAWDGHSRLMLSFGGIESLYKTQVATTVDTDIDYNPYVYQVTTTAVIGQTYVEALIPFDYINMPEGIMFRNPSTGKVFDFDDDITSYPQIRTVLGTKYWVVAIHGGNASAGDILDVLDCLWGYVDAPDVECDDEVAIVYPGSVQKIPVEKVTDDRWYILHRNMVRSIYQGDTIDLTQFEVHKLYDTVDVACFTEDCSLITIHKKLLDTDMEPCDDDTTPCSEIEVSACATVVDAKLGVVEIHEVEVITDDNGDPVLDTDGCPTFRQKEPDCTESLYGAYKITVSYRTNPVQSGISNLSAVEVLRRAIAARVAAEVVLVNCGCNVECGFFKDMRVETNTQVYTRDGGMIVALRYGNKMGQQIYAQALEAAPRLQRVSIF